MRRAIPSARRTIASQTRDLDGANLRCAREILRDPEPFGGTSGGMYAWAMAVIDRLQGRAAA
jgi:hypothetical protein